MKGFIYKITNKVNGKSYIGQTRYSVEFRLRQHLHKKDNTYFHNALHKYGVENFNVETLEECDIEKLNEREIYYIAKYNTFKEGYNLTIGGEGNRTLLLDNKYEEITSLYLSGFSCFKISQLFNVDKVTINKILKQLGVKIRNKKISINRQEFIELVNDYKTGYSLKELAKRYDCSDKGLKEYLIKKGVDIKIKYSILEDKEAQENMIKEYLDGDIKYRNLLNKYHCSNNTFNKILSLHGIKRIGNKNPFKMNDKECLEAIRLYKEGVAITKLSHKYNVDRTTIYSMLKRYHINII